MKTFILSLLKHTKSFNNLLLNLSIKYVSSFNYIKSITNYYSYFRWIMEYFKAYRFYSLFKIFFKIIAFINILLSIFTLIVFTDFRYDDYKLFIDHNIINFSFNELFIKFRKAIRSLFRYITTFFEIDDIESIKKPTSSYESKSSDNIPSNTKSSDNLVLKSDSYTPYYCLVAFITVIVCFKYPEYTVTPIISGITAFVSSLLGGNDDPSGSIDPSGGNDPLNKGKGRAHPINTTNLDHLRTFKPDTDFNAPSSTSSTKSFLQQYFPILGNKTVSSIGKDPNDMLSGNPFADYLSDSSSESSSSTVTPGSSTVTDTKTVGGGSIDTLPTDPNTPSAPNTPTTPGMSKAFRPRWSPSHIKDPWKP